jgi:hypothetical protein
VRDLPAIRRFMPFVSPRRNESLVYFRQEIDVESALRLVERLNVGRAPEARITLFHLLLRGMARVLHERPRLNRFVAGGRVWQRDGIWLSFSLKKAMSDAAPLTTLKLRFDPDESLEALSARIVAALGVGRSDAKSTADLEMGLLLRAPVPVTRLALRVAWGLDALGLLPRAMIASDPLFASAFIANLGSVGLDAGYHHLWEHGNVSIFCVVGRVQTRADGRRAVELKWSYDERVEDGLYCAKSLELLRGYVEAPESLV